MKLPDVNERITVYADTDGVLSSRVEDAREPDVVVIAPPSDGMDEVPVAIGSEVTIEWVTLRGLHRGIGRATMRAEVPVPAIVVKLASSEIVQRRDHVRADMNVEVVIERESRQKARGTTVDVSGGGIRVKIVDDVELDDGEVVDIAIGLENEPPIDVVARVLRRVDEGTYAFRFEEVAAAAHEILIRHVFETHRKQYANRRRLIA